MRCTRLAAAILLVLGLLAAPGRAADITGVVYDSTGKHWYKLYTTTATWATAKSNAESVGGYLACVTSSAENSFLVTNLGTSSTPFIGGTDQVSEGNWTWVSGETWSWTNWASGEPNNVNEEDALQFRTDGQWNDVPTGNSYSYIVEWNSDPNGPPAVPTTLKATAVSESQVNLTWVDASTGETGFEVERAVGAGAFEALTSPAAEAVSYADQTVAAETDYSYRIRSVGSNGASEWSNTATVTTPPPTSISLSATALSTSRVELRWTNVATTATSIEVERGVGSPGTNFKPRTTTTGTATTYLDTTAVAETLHAYRIRVVGPGGKSGYSQEAYVTMPPATPSGLGLLASSDTQVVLGWNDTSFIETGFDIERGNGWPTSTFSPLASVAANVRAYTDDTVSPESTYTYRLRAHNDSGSSDWSVEGHVTTQPRTPADFAAAAISASRMRLTWSDVSLREIGFTIQRARADDGLYADLANVDFGVEEYVDASARQEDQYLYRVAARSMAGHSNWAELTAPRMPALLAIRKVTVTTPGATKKAAAPPRVVVVGEFDTGGRDVDLLGAASFEVGSTSLPIPTPARRGRTIRYDADGVRLDLTPSTTTSRVGFQLQADGDIATALDREGVVTLAYVNGDFRAVGAVRLAGGVFQPPARGGLADPSSYVVSVVAALKPGGKDTITMKVQFDPSGGLPAVIPQLSVRVGTATFISLAGDFAPRGNKLVLKKKVEGGTRKVTLDFTKGIATISIRGGADVGTFAKGSVPVGVGFSFGGLSFEDTLSMTSSGRSLKY